jgi:hypothetical protein
MTRLKGRLAAGVAAALLVAWLALGAARAPAAPPVPAPAGPAGAPPAPADADEPPVIPFGPDAYTAWDRWPTLRIGVRAYMKSTFDRLGGNHNADAAHFLRQIPGGPEGLKGVALDEVGPGILWFVRHNHWHGSPWTYEVDGTGLVVEESSTKDPLRPVENAVFLPEALFPRGLTWTWAVTRGADLSWVPIPFENSLRLDYGRSRYGTGYFIFWRVMPGARLSRPLESWTRAPPPAEVLALIARSGTDIAPAGRDVATRRGTLALRPHETKTVAWLSDGPGTIRRLWFQAPEAAAEALLAARLRITWDDRRQPSVDAPLGLFFGTASLMRTPGQTHIVKSFPMTVLCDDRRRACEFATYFPMPYHRSARVEIAEGAGKPLAGVRFEVRTQRRADPPHEVGWFHATYRDFPNPERGRDLTLLDTRETEGGGDWCGHLVGTTYLFTRTATLSTLEGDPRFFLDDSLSPQGQGTGSEEWGGGGDYWGGRTMTLPFAGHPVGKPQKEATTDLERVHSAYRFLLGDLVPFGRNARFTLEHGAENDGREPYETVAYWYGVDRPCLVPTDALDVGDLADEQRHEYRTAAVAPVYDLVSRVELGVDALPVAPRADARVEVYPPIADNGRRTRGAIEFALRIRKDNVGVMLRRRLDLAYPNQRARVRVSDPGPERRWRDAGVWYTAGGNTVVFGDPRATAPNKNDPRLEIAPAASVVETSNRRFREDEFLIPRALTEGRDRIYVRLEPDLPNHPLVPGQPPPETAWTEHRTWAYSFVVPRP